MDFFAQQARTRRMIWIFTGLFVLAALLVAVAVNWIAGLVLLFMHDPRQPMAPETRAFWRWFIVLCTLGGIGLVSWTRMQTLRCGGGPGLAAELGGVPAHRQDLRQRQLINVVDEMALAAGIPAPLVFVLPQESGINALAAGYGLTDTAVVFSRGAVEKLSRDELQAVAGHEISHILSGDMRLNMWLLGMLHGIMALGIAGREMVYTFGRIDSPVHRKSMPMAALGILIWGIGSLGVFFGRILQAAASRQREYRADAFSVQFTRNPAALTGVLRKIAVMPSGSDLDNAQGEAVGHMCVASARSGFFSFFATHPPLEKRVLALDPDFDLALLQKPKADYPLIVSSSLPPEEDDCPMRPEGLEQLAGLAGMAMAGVESPSLRCALPPSLREAARTPRAVGALLPALLIAESPENQKAMLDRVSLCLGNDAAELCAALVEQCLQLPAALNLPLADAAFPTLRALEPEERRELILLLPQLARMNGRMSLFGYCLNRLLRQRLEQAQLSGPEKVQRNDAAQYKEALTNLFAVFAVFGAKDEAGAARAFALGMQQVTRQRFAYRPPLSWTADLDFALDKLTRIKEGDRIKIVRGLIVTMRADGVISVQENQLLRLIIACFNLPAEAAGKAD